MIACGAAVVPLTQGTLDLADLQCCCVPCSQVAAVWKDYFVFTVTRDPLSRAVSQYYFLLHSNLAGPPGCREAVRGQVQCGVAVWLLGWLDSSCA